MRARNSNSKSRTYFVDGLSGTRGVETADTRVGFGYRRRGGRRGGRTEVVIFGQWDSRDAVAETEMLFFYAAGRDRENYGASTRDTEPPEPHSPLPRPDSASSVN